MRLKATTLAANSELGVAMWLAGIPDPTLADAICDRLVHTAHRLELQGPSLRDPKVRAHRNHTDPERIESPSRPAKANPPPEGGQVIRSRIPGLT